MGTTEDMTRAEWSDLKLKNFQNSFTTNFKNWAFASDKLMISHSDFIESTRISVQLSDVNFIMGLRLAS